MLETFFTRVGFYRLTAQRGAGTTALFVALTWLPLVILTALSHELMNARLEESFLFDFGAHVQYLVAIPALILARPYVERALADVPRYLVEAGLVRACDHDALWAEVREATRLCRRWQSEILGWLFGFAASLVWVNAELGNGVQTWHAHAASDGERLTLAGYWVAIVSVPLFNYWWARWACKGWAWCRFLWRVSRIGVWPVATHPDRSGGLGYLGRAHGAFGVLVFVCGVTVAATSGYPLLIEGTPPDALVVWGPFVAYVMIAPVVTLAPLLVFSETLRRTKRAALATMSTRAAQLAAELEARAASSRTARDALPRYAAIGDLGHAYEAVVHLRAVPFDWLAVGRLVGTAAGSMLPLVTETLALRASLGQPVP